MRGVEEDQLKKKVPVSGISYEVAMKIAPVFASGPF